MNDKLKYAEMLEIPLNTCNITFNKTKPKKAKKVNSDRVKEEVISKVNEDNNEIIKNEDLDFSTANVNNDKKQKKPFKLSVVKVETVIICLLLATICLTSIFIPTSGINSFFNKRSKEVAVVDNRTFSDFSPVFDFSKEEATFTGGVVTVKKQGSIYAPCDGKVSSVTKGDDNLYTIEVAHSENFKTVISGLEYAYTEVGNTVYKTIPIGYVKDKEISVFFKDGENIIVTDDVISTCMTAWS